MEFIEYLDQIDVARTSCLGQDPSQNGALELKPGVGFLADLREVFAVFALRKASNQIDEGLPVDETSAIGDLLQAGDLEPLSVFDRGDVVTGFEQACLRPGVQPGHPSGEQFHVELILALNKADSNR